MSDQNKTNSNETERTNWWNGENGYDDREFWQENQIIIEVKRLENIDTSKVKEISIRIEFRSQILLETENITIPEAGECILDISASIPMYQPLEHFMDNILACPILFIIINETKEIKQEKDVISQMKRESKEESKAASSVKSGVQSSNPSIMPTVLGYCNMDVGPLIKGKTIIQEYMVVESVEPSFGPNIVTWSKLPRMLAIASVESGQLIPTEINKLINNLQVTIESVYNAPSNAVEGSFFDAHISVPMFGNKMNVLTFSNGCSRRRKDCECRKRWATLSHVEGSGAFSKYRTSQSVCDIINPENIDLKQVFSENAPCIQWNKWRSCIMVKTGSNFFFKKIKRCGVWPIEIVSSYGPPSQTNEKQEKKFKNSVNSTSAPQHYVAYLPLGSLLFPGVTRARVASGLYTYSSSDIIQKCGKDFVLKIPISNNPGEIEDIDKFLMKGPEGNQFGNVAALPLYNDQGNRTFIVAEIEVWKPYISKKSPDYYFDKFSAHIIPKGFNLKEIASTQTKKQFVEIVEKLSFVINKCYGDFISAGKKGNSFDGNDEDSFFRYLCKEEMFQKMKLGFEDKIVNLIGGTYGDITSEQREKIPKIFTYLVNQMRKITNQTGTYKNKLPNLQLTEADDFQLSAEEAVESGNFRLAKRYLLEKLSLNKLNPDYWLDYALFSNLLEDHEKSIESIREALLLDIEHRMGLLMYGLALIKIKDYCLAQLTFQVLLDKYPDFVEGWMVLHLLFISIGDLERTDFSLQMASRLECDRICNKEEVKKNNESNASTLLSESAVQMSHSENVTILAEGKYGISSFSNGQITADPLGWTIALSRYCSLYIRTAVLMLRLGEFEFAEIALTQEALAQTCHSVQYLYYLAVSHYLRGNYNDAISHLKIAIKDFGKNSFLETLMGHCYFKLHCYDKCIECYEFVLESNNKPNDIRLVYVRMGIYYMQTKKFECAKRIFLCVCKCSPSSESWLRLGIVSYNLGEFKEAEAALTEANLLDSACPIIWAYLTLVNIQLQRYDVFQLCYEEAKKKNLKDTSLIQQIETLVEVNRLKF